MTGWLLLVACAVMLLGLGLAAGRRQPDRGQVLSATVDRPCGVYIIPALTGQRPAYVGEGFDPGRRIACHRREADWRHLADWRTRPTIEWHPSKTAARARERDLIVVLAPLGNDRHNRGRGLQSVAW